MASGTEAERLARLALAVAVLRARARVRGGALRVPVLLRHLLNWLTGEWATSGLRFSERFPLN